MRVFDFLHNFDIIELDVQKLVYRFEGSANGYVVLQFYRYLMIDQGFEEANQLESAG